MATIVQPYNDWRERAIVNLVGPIIGDWIQRSREAENNRKQNALNAKVMQEIYGNNPSNLINTQPAQNSGNLWENAARNGFNPLEQFDLGTANVAPAQQKALPSLAEMAQIFAKHAGSERFGMLDPQKAWQLFNPFLQANEATKTEQRKMSLVETLKAAKDEAEKRNAMLGGYVMGDVPIEGVNAAQKQYEYENPYKQQWNYNAGGQSYFGSFDPITGKVNPNLQIDNSLTPQQVLQNEQFDKTMQYNLDGRNWQQGFETRKQDFIEEKATWEQQHPELRTIVDKDGKLWGYNPRTGQTTPVIGSDGQQLIVDTANYGTTRSNSSVSESNKINGNYVGAKRDRINQLEKRRNSLEKILNDQNYPLDDERRKSYEAKLQRVEAELEKEKKELDDYFAKYTGNPQNQNTSPAANNTILYSHPSIKQSITVDDYEELKRQAEAGNLKDNDTGKLISPDEIDEWLQKDGWVKSGNEAQNTSTNSATLPTQPSSFDVNTQNVRNDNVGLTHRLTEQEKQRAALQGDTGRQIANESNSEVMWEDANGNTISKSEYDNRIKLANMTQDDYDRWLEAQGYRRADNSHTQAPLITDVVNETTPQAIQAQVAHLNGDDNNFTFAADGIRTPLDTLTDFMSETPTVNDAFRQKYPDFKTLPIVRNYTPDDYSPYDVNSTQPEPYSQDDPYEQGFEFDNNANPPNNGNSDFQMLPIINNGNNMGTIAARRKNEAILGTTREKENYRKYQNHIDSNANRYGVDKNLIRAMIQVESAWKPNARSHAGAMGLMQLMPGTARELGVKNAYDPAQNIMGGTKYISRMIRRYKGNLRKAVMAYNAGPGNINKGRIPQETRNYVQKVMAIYNRLSGRNV